MNFQHRIYFQGKEFKDHSAFWTNAWREFPDYFNLNQRSSSDKSAPSFETKCFKMEGDIYSRMFGFDSMAEGLHLTVIFSIFSLLIKKYTGESQIIIDSQLYQAQNIPKLYCDVVPILLTVKGDVSLREHLNMVKEMLKQCYRYQNYPLEMVLGQEKPPKKTNIFLGINDETREEKNHYDISFFCNKSERAFQIECRFNKKMFDVSFIERFFQHFINVTAYLDSLDVALAEIKIVCNEELALLESYGVGKAVSRSDANLIDRFLEVAKNQSSCTAIRFGDHTMTYKQLHDRSDELALRLMASGNVRGKFIAVYLNRSPDTVSAMLGVFKAGGVYLPLNVRHPLSRIKSILTDCEPVCMITTTEFLFDFSFYPGKIIAMDIMANEEDPSMPLINVPLSNDDLAYVIYTSGSTGIPKGVAVSHNGLMNMVMSQVELLTLTQEDNVLQFAPVSFDASFYEIWIALASGASITIAQDEVFEDIPYLVRTIATQRVTVLVLPPSYLKLFDKAPLPTVTTIVSAGEPVDPSDANFYRKFKLFINAYGPTECSVCVSTWKIKAAGYDTIFPIGAPISNTSIFILDEDLNLRPLGWPGEICVSGPGNAVGYINSPELTSDRFVDNQFGDSSPMLYRSGDMGRWNLNGQLEFLGRKDEQIKLNGNRIELGELEQTIRGHIQIKDAAVVPFDEGSGKFLIAFIVLQKPDEEDEEHIRLQLKNYLVASMPQYMLPSIIKVVKQLPLTSNFKVNRTELISRFVAEKQAPERVAPRNGLEKRIADIWCTILNVHEIGIHENFFQLGGNSLKGIRLAFEIHQKLNIKLDLSQVFNFPTIAELCEFLRAQPVSAPLFFPIEEMDTYPVSFAQRRLWFIHKIDTTAVNYNISTASAIHGNFSVEIFNMAFKAVMKKYEILRTTFVEQQGDPRQKVHPAESPHELAILDLAQHNESDYDGLIQEVGNRPFDLEKDFLIRATVAKIQEGKHILILCLHHCIADGESMKILVRELISFYVKYLHNDLTDEPLTIQFKDYAYWQREQFAAQTDERHDAYWNEIFSSIKEPLLLPRDFERKRLLSSEGKTLRSEIPVSVVNNLRSIAQKQAISLFNIVVAITHIFLHRITNQKDIITGIPITDRSHPQLENQIGFFVNTLPITTHIDSDHSFIRVLRSVTKSLMNAYEHSVYPLDQIIEDHNLPNLAGRSSLFDVFLSFDAYVGENEYKNVKLDVPFEIKNYEIAQDVSGFDLAFNFTEEKQKMVVEIQFDTQVFKADTIEILMLKLGKLIAAVAVHPELEIHYHMLDLDIDVGNERSLSHYFNLDQAF